MNNNTYALITGATSGIGAAYAKALAQKGYNLLLTGRRKEKLMELADRLKTEYSIKIEVLLADFTNEEDLKKVIDRISKCENLEYVINNAGYGHGKSFSTDTYENQQKMLQVHIHAAAHIVHSAVPILKKQKKGFIINVSSLASFTPFGNAALYCSTKAFLNMFSECLSRELKIYNIKVQALCPGFTRTNFHNKLGMDSSKLKNNGLIRWMHADEVVRQSLQALSKEKVIVIPGISNVILYYLVKLLPKRIYNHVTQKDWDAL